MRPCMLFDEAKPISMTHLRRTLGDHLASPLRPLPGAQVLTLLTVRDLRSLLNNLLALSQDHLDVAWVRHCA